MFLFAFFFGTEGKIDFELTVAILHHFFHHILFRLGNRFGTSLFKHFSFLYFILQTFIYNLSFMSM